MAIHLLPKQALALLDANFYTGPRWYVGQLGLGDNSSRILAHESSTDLHLQPLAALPLALGLSHSSIKLRRSALPKTVRKAQMTVHDLELCAWQAVSSRFTPYVKVRYHVDAKLALSYEELPTGPKHQQLPVGGYHGSLGLKYQIIPIVALMLEIGKGLEVIRDPDGKRQTLASSTILGGVAVVILR